MIIVELMDPSEVVNGEELEECTFKARGKLFRLSSKEWVEKGIGNMKVSRGGRGRRRKLGGRGQALPGLVVGCLLCCVFSLGVCCCCWRWKR